MVIKQIRIGSTFLLLALILTVNSNCKQNDNPVDSSSASGQWRLVWQDEFEGVHLNEGKWNYEIGGHGWGNNELQYYTDRPENIYVTDGLLVIEAREERFENRSFTSGRITTKNKGDWLYGKIEVKAKLPKGKGLWPAVWMLPTDWKYGGWASSGEIDIMELVGNDPTTVWGSLHYGGEYPNNFHTNASFVQTDSTDFSDDFHLFSIEWMPGEIRWYVDSQLYQTISEWYTEQGIYPAPFDARFHLLLNVAVGGNWPGAPDSTTSFPQRMYVDFIRVYENTLAPPKIEITYPDSSHNQFKAYSNIPIEVRMQSEQTIQHVEFFIQKKRIGKSTVSPYRYVWEHVRPGRYFLVAKVKTENGITAMSPAIEITVQ